MTHTGTAGAVHELDVRREHVLDPVPVDRVRVPAAHLHELEVLVAGELGDARDERSRRPRVPVLVDEAHRVAYATLRQPGAVLGQLQSLGE